MSNDEEESDFSMCSEDFKGQVSKEKHVRILQRGSLELRQGRGRRQRREDLWYTSENKVKEKKEKKRKSKNTTSRGGTTMVGASARKTRQKNGLSLLERGGQR